jgi:uncharacterized protein YjaG (DUF416 family)
MKKIRRKQDLLEGDAIDRELSKQKKTFVFKPEFENKLKALKVKTKFLNNVWKNCKEYNLNFQKQCEKLNNLGSWLAFNLYAFIWAEYEGVEFWVKVCQSEIVPRETTFSRK